MNAEENVALQRLSVLQLAETLRSVNDACRQHGMTRTMFYEYEKRVQTHGLEGLKDLPPIYKSHHFTTPPEVVQRILELSLAHPSKGCRFISDLLKLEGPYVSGATLQIILDNQGMGTRFERLLKLEAKHLEEGLELST